MPKVWKRSRDGLFFVTIDQIQHRLTRDRKESERMAAELVLAAKPELRSKDRVDALLDAFLDWTQRNKAAKTYASYRDWCSSFATHVGGLKVRDLKPHHVHEWLETHYPNATDATLSIATRTVKRAFSWAVQQGYLMSSPIATIKAKAGHPRDVYIEPEQFAEFLHACGSQQIRDFAQFLWSTGCRPFEAYTLERRHLSNGCCEFEIEESKGKRTGRIVPLDEPTWQMVSRLVVSNDPYVFRNTRRKPWTIDSVNSAFRTAERKVGFRIFPYALRHSFITRALLNGLNPIEVATIVGHADLNMIQKTYSKLSKKTEFLRSRVAIANASTPVVDYPVVDTSPGQPA